jgi:hypothetical protein
MAQQSMCDIIPHGMEVSPTRPWNGRASTKCLAFQLNKSGIRTGSLRTKLSVARKRNFQSRDKGAETASRGQGRPNSPLPGSGIFKAETKGPKRFRRWVLRLFTETTKPRPARTAGGAPRPALKCLPTCIHRKRPTLAALPVDVKAWTCPASTRSNRVSSNRSLRCGETEFSGPRQRGRNGLGDSRTPAQRQISLGNRRGAEAACATDIAC